MTVVFNSKYDVVFMMWDWDERFMMNELKDEVERWELRKTSLSFWIEFF